MPAGDYYELLGVERTATADDVRAAYRRRAMVFHPDKHAAAPEEVRLEADRIMAALNVAYETLSDPGRRSSYDAELRAGAPSRDGWLREARPPRPGECWMCASSPAIDVVLQQHIGKLLWREKRVMEATLCRSCGRAMVAAVTNRTMLTGWWGVISFLVNWGAIWNNWRAWRRVSALAAPNPTSDRVLVPMPGPAPPTKPVLQWGGVWVTAALVGFLAVLGMNEQQAATASTVSRSVPSAPAPNSGPSSVNAPPPAPRIDSIYDLDGLCLRYDMMGESIEDVVFCSERHDAKVQDVVWHEDDCWTDFYFVTDDGVLCVDG